MASNIILIGELVVDVTIPVCFPIHPRTLRRRAEPIFYEQVSESKVEPGGVFFIARFLNHFADLGLNIIYPMPTRGIEGNRLINEIKSKIENEFNHVKTKPVAVERNIYEATRFFEVSDEKSKRGIIRIDSGDSSKFGSNDIQNMICTLRDVLQPINYNHPTCLFLADYDLGLFTNEFIEELKKLIKKSKIPETVVYAGKSWRKYCDLPNCTIISDKSEAIEDFMQMPGLEDEEVIIKESIEKIAKRFPQLKGIVLVDKKAIEYAIWPPFERKSGLAIEKFTYNPKLNSPRTPTGYRGLIAGLVAMHKLKNIAPERWLHRFDEIAPHCFTILNGEKLDNDTIQNINITEDILSSATILAEIHPMKKVELPISEIFVEELWKNRLILKIEDAKTCLPGYLTMDQSLKKQIEDVINNFRNNTDPKTIFNQEIPLVASKLLIYGQSGGGKTELAKAIADAFINEINKKRTESDKSFFDKEKDILHCEKISKHKEPQEVAVHIEDFIKSKGSGGVSILDEIDKMKEGKLIQSTQLVNLNTPCNPYTSLENLSLIIPICSIDDVKRINKKDKKNSFDFYDRFPTKIKVTSFEERPLDPVYICADKLHKAGITEVSLAALQAIIDTSQKSFRGINGLLDRIIQELDRKELMVNGSEFINRISISLQFTIPGDKYRHNYDKIVTIVP